MDNPILSNIYQRRSIRSYEDKPVDGEVIEEIIRAGRYAPSATNKQPWKFIVITDKKVIEEIADEIKTRLLSIVKLKSLLKLRYPELRNEKTIRLFAGSALSKTDVIFFDAPVLVLVCCKKHRFFDESCACCAENMMLAAHSMDIGSCWIGLTSFIKSDSKVSKEIGVPEDHHISAALVFGHPSKKNQKPPMRSVTSDVIRWIGKKN